MPGGGAGKENDPPAAAAAAAAAAATDPPAAAPAAEKKGPEEAKDKPHDDGIGPGDEAAGIAEVGWHLPCACTVLNGVYSAPHPLPPRPHPTPPRPTPHIPAHVHRAEQAEVTFRQINKVTQNIEYYVHFEECPSQSPLASPPTHPPTNPGSALALPLIGVGLQTTSGWTSGWRRTRWTSPR